MEQQLVNEVNEEDNGRNLVDDNASEFQYFQVPEVEMRCTEKPVPRRRKRKQDLVEIKFDDSLKLTFQSKSRSRKRVPLYLLNPDDFNDDPIKQRQIIRAINAHRHHTTKDEKIVNLTEEVKNLRIHNQALIEKVRELSRCGCYRNCVANLDVLDVVVPVVPPNKNIQMNQESLAVPVNNVCPKPAPLYTMGPRSPLNMLPGWTPTESMSAVLNRTSIPAAVNDKPFITTKSSYHRNQLILKTPTNDYVSNIANHRATSSLHIPTTNGNPALSTLPFQTILQPGNFATTITGAISSNYPGRFTPLLSEVNTSPANVVPPSRIVFAKRGSAYKTIQRLNQLSLPKNYIAPPVRMPVNASQLVIANNRAAGEGTNVYAMPSCQLLPRMERNTEGKTFIPHRIQCSVPTTYESGVSKGSITVPRFTCSPLVRHLSPETRRQIDGKQEIWNLMQLYGNNEMTSPPT